MLRYVGAILILIVALVSSQPAFGFVVPKEVVLAASEGVQEYIKTMPRDELVRCGFPVDFRAGEIEVGPPMKVLAFDAARLTDGSARTANEVLRETHMWFFPVLCRGQNISILTVDFYKDAWRAVGLGKTALSRELQIALSEIAPTAPHETYLAKYYSLKADFLVFKSGAEYSFYPLRSARIALGGDPSKAEPSAFNFESLLKMIDERKGAKEE